MDVAKLSATSAQKGKVLWELKVYKGICAGHGDNLNLLLSADIQCMQS